MKVLNAIRIAPAMARSNAKQRRIALSLTSPKETMNAPTPISAETILRQVQTSTPLKICAVLDRLPQVSLGELAKKAGCGKSTLHGIFKTGVWPTRLVVNRAAILKHMADNGATQEELDTLFEPSGIVVRSGRPPSSRGQSTPAADPPHDYLETDMLLGKQTLTLPARKAFGLMTNPFGGEVMNEADMFVSSEVRFIREACLQTAKNGAFVAVLGESGAGKTTIMSDLKERVANDHEAIITIEPSVLAMEDSDTTGKSLKSGDILRAGIATLDPLSKPKQSIEGRTRQFVELLEASVQAGNKHLLLIEEAHSLPIATLKHLKRLHERTRIGRSAALGILLIAHPELRNKLNERRHDVREVFQRCEILELMPLDSDLAGYLAHRAKQGGKQLSELITDAGVEQIRQRLTVVRAGNASTKSRHVSLLYPLAVNNLITACLNLAAHLGAPVVDADIVKGV